MPISSGATGLPGILGTPGRKRPGREVSFRSPSLNGAPIFISGVASSNGAAVATAVGSALGIGVAASAGLGGATSVGTAISASPGSSSGVSTPSGVSSSIAASGSSSAGVAAASGTGSSVAKSPAAAAGTGAAQASGLALVAGAGASSGVGAVASVGGALAASAASAAGLAGASGHLAALSAASASTSGVAGVSGQGRALVSAQGAVAGIAYASGFGNALASGVASSAGLSASTGDGSTLQPYSSTIYIPSSAATSLVIRADTTTVSIQNTNTEAQIKLDTISARVIPYLTTVSVNPMPFTIAKDNTLPPLRAVLSQNGLPINLNGSTVTFKMWLDAALVVNSVATVVVAAQGFVEYPWQPADTATAGDCKAEFVIVNGGSILTVPNAARFDVKIVG